MTPFLFCFGFIFYSAGIVLGVSAWWMLRDAGERLDNASRMLGEAKAFYDESNDALRKAGEQCERDERAGGGS